MTTEVPEKIMSKIRKCLALSESSNEHEAAAALRQAQKMMAEWNVTEAGLKGSEIGVEEASSTVWKNVPVWENAMANMVGEAFGCKVLIRDGARNVLAKYSYVGLAQNAKLAAYTHVVFSKQVRKARERYLRSEYPNAPRGRKILLGNSFGYGYVTNVRSKIVAMGVTQEVKDKVEELTGGRVAKTAKKVNIDFDALLDGKREGATASLHRPLN